MSRPRMKTRMLQRMVLTTLAVLATTLVGDIAVAVDLDAPVVLVRYRPSTSETDPCTGLGNCFTYTASTDTWTPESNVWLGPTGWIWDSSGRNPTATNPLLVDVGPGTYPRISCSQSGHVTFRGSGRDVTTLTATGNIPPIGANNCEKLTFISLGTRGESFGAMWSGSGDSTWVDVDLLAVGTSVGDAGLYGWLDSGVSGSCGTHYFHGSRIRAVPSGSQSRQYVWGYLAGCGESWFFGGEVHADLSQLSGNITGRNDFAAAIAVAYSGDFRAFGSTIRATVGDPGPGLVTLNGVLSLGGGTLHSHGSIVNVTAKDNPSSGSGVNVLGLKTTENTFMHTPGTTFVLNKNASASATRIDTSAGGTVLSPFVWQPSASPPPITSLHGSDVFVETDCLGSDCNSAGGEAHMMVYDTSCTTNGAWRDMATGNCRQ